MAVTRAVSVLGCEAAAAAEWQVCYSSLASRLSGLGGGLLGARWQDTVQCCRQGPC